MLAEFVHLLGSSEGIAQWMYLLVIFVFVVNAALGHVENIDKALKYFCLGLIPVAILCGAYVFELRSPLPGEELVTDEGLRFRGPVADPNYLASVLVCGLGICLGSLRLSRRLQSMIIYSVGAGLFLSAIWATQSRGGLYTSGALMALTATQALMAQRRKSSKIVILISLLLLTGSTLVALNSPSRFNAILETRGIELGRSVSNAAINEILEHPLFGIGDALYLTKHGLAPHNTYLSFAVAAGFLGLGIALTIFSLCAIWTLRSSKLWAEAAFMCLMGSLIILGSFSALGHKPLWFAATVASFAMKKERENGFPP